MKINHSRRQIFVPWILFVGMVGMVFAMNPKLLGPKISPQKCLGKEDDPYEGRIGVLCCLDLYLQFAQDSDSKKNLYVINVIPVVTGNWQVAYNQLSMYLSIWANYYSWYTWIHGIWEGILLLKPPLFPHKSTKLNHHFGVTWAEVAIIHPIYPFYILAGWLHHKPFWDLKKKFLCQEFQVFLLQGFGLWQTKVKTNNGMATGSLPNEIVVMLEINDGSELGFEVLFFRMVSAIHFWPMNTTLRA